LLFFTDILPFGPNSGGSSGGGSSSSSTRTIPGDGGDFRIREETEFEFVPDTTGTWEFFTSDNEDSEVFIDVLDEDDEVIASVESRGSDPNVSLSVQLEEGETYYIIAGFIDDDSGSFRLNIVLAGTGTPTPSPSPSPGTDPGGVDSLPGRGGDIRVGGTSDISFTPDSSGLWEFATWDNTDCDPVLEIHDAWGNFVAWDDDSGGNLNALIVVYLDAGVEYTINAGFYGREGSYMLSVIYIGSDPGGSPPPATPSPTPPTPSVSIPNRGGDVNVNGYTELSFTPSTTGMWEFRTSNNVGDPYLEIYDAWGTLIAYDDDGAGDLNSLIITHLNAGETYTVAAGFFWGGTGSYRLSVTEARMETIPARGGTVRANGPTNFLFTPDTSGVWEFETTNNGTSDPMLTIFTAQNDFIDWDDDSGSGYNAFISVNLQAGVTYLIMVEYYFQGASNACDLIVTRR